MLAVHSREDLLSPEDLPEKIRSALAAAEPAGMSAYKPPPEAILATLKKEGGNVRRAAGRLGLSRQQLYRLLESIPDFDMESFRKSRP
jgi:transcriptional regulator of acetoin/glycerol metabolism